MPKILIIEDSTLMSDMLSDILEEFQSVRIFDGIQALKYLGIDPPHGMKEMTGELKFLPQRWSADPTPNLPPDLILCDCVMPSLDGYALVKLLSVDEKARRIPIIMVTAKAKMDQPFRELPNVVDFIVKPFTPTKVLDTVRKALADASGRT